MKNAAIKDAKAIADSVGADAVVVLAFKGDTVAGASYGKTKALCKKTWKWMDWLIDAMTNEGLPRPATMIDMETK